MQCLQLASCVFLIGIWILGRKEIIAEFKALVSSFPQDMGSMQRQLSKYKEAASDVHSLRADVQSLSTVLDRKVGCLVTCAVIYVWYS